MKYKLLAVDIDGTLFNSQGKLTPETASAVKRFINAGGYFVLSTGRPFQAISKLVQELELQNMPYILYNGAMVMFGGEIIYSLTLNASDTRAIADEGHIRKSTMVCWSNNALYSEEDSEKVRFYKAISGVEPIILDDLGTLGGSVTKFVWYDNAELTAKYHKEMKEKYSEFNTHPSRDYFLEFVNKDCSKATAVQIICDKLNLRREETVAVGDGYNDLPMITYAGLGVAMENAPDDVKAQADYVTLSCDENGVANLIDKILKE